MMKPAWKLCASSDNPNAAALSHNASPIHMAARNGKTSRGPLASTRATSAAMLGPGIPALITKAPAKISMAAMSISEVSGSQYRLASDIGRHRISDEAFLMCAMMEFLQGFWAWLLLAGKDDLRSQDNFNHGKLAFGIFGHGSLGLIDVAVDPVFLTGREHQEGQHVAARQARNKGLFRVDACRIGKPRHHLR